MPERGKSIVGIVNMPIAESPDIINAPCLDGFCAKRSPNEASVVEKKTITEYPRASAEYIIRYGNKAASIAANIPEPLPIIRQR